MIVVVPALTPVTTPDELTVATEGSDDDHDTALFVAFDGVTVAVKVFVAPMFKDNVDLFNDTDVTGTIADDVPNCENKRPDTTQDPSAEFLT